MRACCGSASGGGISAPNHFLCTTESLEPTKRASWGPVVGRLNRPLRLEHFFWTSLIAPTSSANQYHTRYAPGPKPGSDLGPKLAFLDILIHSHHHSIKAYQRSVCLYLGWVFPILSSPRVSVIREDCRRNYFFCMEIEICMHNMTRTTETNTRNVI